MVLIGFWVLQGESFLSVTKRVPADTLIVEGWIGREALPGAKQEFKRGGYNRLVITGGLTGHSWSENRSSITATAERDLLRLGFPSDKLLQAPCEDVDNQRTYESAMAAKRMMELKELHPKSINVLTRKVHARRTHLVYRKIFSPAVEVGIISWDPYVSRGMWWQSSTRAKELLDETFGFAYEALLSSGRSDGRVKARVLVAAVLGLSLSLFLRRWGNSRNAEKPRSVPQPATPNHDVSN